MAKQLHPIARPVFEAGLLIKQCYLSHQDFSEAFEVFPQLWFSGLPGQPQHDQVGALGPLHPLVLGHRVVGGGQLFRLPLVSLGHDRYVDLPTPASVELVWAVEPGIGQPHSAPGQRLGVPVLEAARSRKLPGQGGQQKGPVVFAWKLDGFVSLLFGDFDETHVVAVDAVVDVVDDLVVAVVCTALLRNWLFTIESLQCEPASQLVN